jgi:hypothetical protein
MKFKRNRLTLQQALLIATELVSFLNSHEAPVKQLDREGQVTAPVTAGRHVTRMSNIHKKLTEIRRHISLFLP